MSSSRWLAPAVLVVLVLSAPARAEDKKDPSKSDLPIQMELVAKTATYKLDLGGKSGADYKKLIEEAKKTGNALPKPPAVDLVLKFTNTSDKDVEFWVGGDPVQTTLVLEGPGAVTTGSNLAFPAIFIGPKPMTLAAGKSHEIPIKQLSHGQRGMGQFTYWTEPGEYKLSAVVRTAIKPAPKGTKEENGFGRVELKTEPVKITVEK